MTTGGAAAAAATAPTCHEAHDEVEEGVDGSGDVAQYVSGL